MSGLGSVAQGSSLEAQGGLQQAGENTPEGKSPSPARGNVKISEATMLAGGCSTAQVVAVSGFRDPAKSSSNMCRVLGFLGLSRFAS